MKTAILNVPPHPAYEATLQVSFYYGRKELLYHISGTLHECYEVIGMITAWEYRQRCVNCAAEGRQKIKLSMIQANMDTYMNLRGIFFTVRYEKRES